MDTPTTHPSNSFETIVFTGKKAEYFKLWMVNTLLSIITLGIYSAWAKVRNTQYMYGHTQLQGHRFEYLATPIQVLKGRLIAITIFIAYVVAAQFYPILSGFISIAIGLIAPLLIVQGMRFNLRHTAYRNVRFGFTGKYAKAYLCFLLFPILNVFSLGLATPWLLKKIDEFIYTNITFGDKKVTTQLRTGVYYKNAFITVAVLLLPFLGLFGLMLEAMQNAEPSQGLISIAFILMYVLGFVASAIFYALRRNHIFNNFVSPELAQCRSNLKVVGFVWLTISNIILLVFTLGLAYPVTQIRKNRMLAAATEVSLTDQIDHMAASSHELDNAFGEELGGVFDVDMSLT